MTRFLAHFGTIFLFFGGLVLLVSAAIGGVYLEWYYLTRYLWEWTLIPQALWLSLCFSVFLAWKTSACEGSGGEE